MRNRHWFAFACALTVASCGDGTTTAKKKDASGDTDNGGNGGSSSPNPGSAGRGGNGGTAPVSNGGGGGGIATNGGSGGNRGGAGGNAGGAGGSAGSGMGGAAGNPARDGGSDARTPDAGAIGIMGKVTCPAMTNPNFNIAMVGAFEEINFGPDGTVYWSNFGQNIGRWQPPYDKPPEKAWAKMPGNIFGMRLNPKRRWIYAGARNTKALYRFSIDDPTKVDKVADVEDGFNGTTLGEDEAVYYTDENGGTVYRVSVEGVKSKVTATALQRPNDISFNPDGELCVNGSMAPSTITCFKLDANHVETGMRRQFKMGPGGGDGIAFDKNGAAYATGGGVWKMEPGKDPVQISTSGGNALEFGAGAVSCQALFTGGPKMIMVDAPGMDVPWHRAP